MFLYLRPVAADHAPLCCDARATCRYIRRVTKRFREVATHVVVLGQARALEQANRTLRISQPQLYGEIEVGCTRELLIEHAQRVVVVRPDQAIDNPPGHIVAHGNLQSTRVKYGLGSFDSVGRRAGLAYQLHELRRFSRTEAEA